LRIAVHPDEAISVRIRYGARNLYETVLPVT
jgi:hypothetical protein